jgi:hypothetical protein
MNFLIQWILTRAIVLSKFENPSWLELPKWELTSFGSVRINSLTFSYTPQSMKGDSQASLLARTL